MNTAAAHPPSHSRPSKPTPVAKQRAWPRVDWSVATCWLLIPALGLAIVGCRGMGGSSNMSASEGAPASVAQSVAEYGYEYDEEGESFADDVAADENVSTTGSQASTAGRSLIFTGEMSIEAADTRGVLDAVAAWLEPRGGFVEQSQITGSPGNESAYVTLRVPQPEYETLRALVRERAEEVFRDESRRADVTAQRADLDARLENLRLTEQELRELLADMRESGGDTESVLAAYRELSTYRGEIESLEARMAALDEQVALSTLVLELRPVPQLAEREARRWQLARSVRSAWVDLVDGLQGMAEGLIYFLIAVLPRLLIGLFLAWLAWLALRPLLQLFRWRPSFKSRSARSTRPVDLPKPKAVDGALDSPSSPDPAISKPGQDDRP